MNRYSAEQYFDPNQQLIDSVTVGHPEPVSHKSFLAFLVGLPLAILFSQIRLSAFVLVLGITFLVAGILSLKNTDHRPDLAVNPVANILIGLELIILFALITFGIFPVTSEMKLGIPRIALIYILFPIAVKPVFCPLLIDYLKGKRCSCSVTAVCIGAMRKDYQDKDETISRYLPVWEYTIPSDQMVLNEENIVPVWDTAEGNRTFRCDALPYQIGYPERGDERLINVDPHHPYDLYSPNTPNLIFSTVCGVGIVCIIMYIAKLLT